MTQIFISYSRKDTDFVRRLAADLEKAGYSVWWDITDLRGGDDWVRLIPEAIEKSEFFIVVLSPHSTASEWVRKEYTQALSLHKKIIPIMLAQTPVPFALNTINYLDFTSETAYPEKVKALLLALGYTGEMPAIASPARPLTLRNLIIPIVVSVVILAALGSFYSLAHRASPTPTPTGQPSLTSSPSAMPSASVTSTGTSEPALTPSASNTPTLTPTQTETLSPSPTWTPSATYTPAFQRLRICVFSLYAETINVRSGPGTTYGRLGDPLAVDTCLAFRAQNEGGTWLLIAPDQDDPVLVQYEGGWIYWDLLGQKAPGLVDLPVVTLTPTPTPSDTPTITPSPTRTPTPIPTDTPTVTPSDTLTPTETETPVS